MKDGHKLLFFLPYSKSIFLWVFTPMLHDYGYLRTQKSIGEGRYSALLNSSIPYYEELVSMIPDANVKPSIPEYPEIADHIRQAIDEVYYGVKEPREALDDAAGQVCTYFGLVIE